MNEPIHIGIIGDFDPNLRHHVATNEALCHAADSLAAPVQTSWLPTESLVDTPIEKVLEPFDALWCAPGSPYRSMDGALRAIRFAREADRPFIGT